jgi:hypothetical protein
LSCLAAALPAPDGASRVTSRDYVAPRTPEEAMLAAIWAELLDVPRVGVDDDFFELGGHSLLAARVCSRIRDAFQKDLPLTAIFVAPTVAGLARALAEHAEADRTSRIERAAPDYERLLSSLDTLPDDEVDALLENIADGEIPQ